MGTARTTLAAQRGTPAARKLHAAACVFFAFLLAFGLAGTGLLMPMKAQAATTAPAETLTLTGLTKGDIVRIYKIVDTVVADNNTLSSSFSTQAVSSTNTATVASVITGTDVTVSGTTKKISWADYSALTTADNDSSASDVIDAPISTYAQAIARALTDKSADATAEGTVDENGSVTFSNVAAGQYLVKVLHPYTATEGTALRTYQPIIRSVMPKADASGAWASDTVTSAITNLKYSTPTIKKEISPDNQNWGTFTNSWYNKDSDPTQRTVYFRITTTIPEQYGLSSNATIPTLSILDAVGPGFNIPDGSSSASTQVSSITVTMGGVSINPVVPTTDNPLYNQSGYTFSRYSTSSTGTYANLANIGSSSAVTRTSDHITAFRFSASLLHQYAGKDLVITYSATVKANSSNTDLSSKTWNAAFLRFSTDTYGSDTNIPMVTDSALSTDSANAIMADPASFAYLATYRMSIKTQDSVSNAVLAGTKYEIDRYNASTQTYDTVFIWDGSKDTNGNYIWKNASGSTAFTIPASQVSGNVIPSPYMRAGTYQIRQTSVPAGYATADAQTVSLGKVYQEGGTAGALTSTLVSGSQDGTAFTSAGTTQTMDGTYGYHGETKTVTFSNVSSTAGILPGTGGAGTVAITVIGLLVMAAAIALLVRNYRKKRGGK